MVEGANARTDTPKVLVIVIPTTTELPTTERAYINSVSRSKKGDYVTCFALSCLVPLYCVYLSMIWIANSTERPAVVMKFTTETAFICT